MTTSLAQLTDDDLAETFREQIVTAAHLVRLHTPTIGLLAVEHILVNIRGALDAYMEVMKRIQDRMTTSLVERLSQEQEAR